jgi:predicted MFS family arabinose efflux permease
VFISLVVAAVGSLGAPLITSVATTLHVSLASAQWTLTITLLAGAVATPVLGRLGAGPRRRETIIGVLGLVALGSLLTVLPLGFGWLLAGRAMQGTGLGLTALMMGVARDHLPASRSASVIALVSVASTIGIGVGYPLSGLLDDLGGLRAAYGLGVVVTVIALATAVRTVPGAPAGRTASVDVFGAALLAAGLCCVLVVLSETSVWLAHLGLAVGVTVIGLALLGCWAAWSLRSAAPLVDLRLLRFRAVAGANLSMLVGGVGMYLLLTLLTRYLQTPSVAGYGFGLSVFYAGLALMPFSVLGFVAGRVVPALVKSPRFGRVGGAPGVLALSALVVAAAFALFAVARSALPEVLVSMAVLGFGVGGFSAAMPAVILAVTPAGETSAAMSFNQVVRSVGFSAGSAVGGLVLAAGTASGSLSPADGAYTTAAWLGAGVMAVTAVLSVAAGGRSRHRE